MLIGLEGASVSLTFCFMLPKLDNTSTDEENEPKIPILLYSHGFNLSCSIRLYVRWTNIITDSVIEMFCLAKYSSEIVPPLANRFSLLLNISLDCSHIPSTYSF